MHTLKNCVHIQNIIIQDLLTMTKTEKKMSMLWNDLPGFMTTFNRVFNIIIFTHTCIYY